eukprot:280093-Alexandrium_andersonii.AAC.1
MREAAEVPRQNLPVCELEGDHIRHLGLGPIELAEDIPPSLRRNSMLASNSQTGQSTSPSVRQSVQHFTGSQLRRYAPPHWATGLALELRGPTMAKLRPRHIHRDMTRVRGLDMVVARAAFTPRSHLLHYLIDHYGEVHERVKQLICNDALNALRVKVAPVPICPSVRLLNLPNIRAPCSLLTLNLSEG